LLFKPGSYDVDVNLGFYTQVLGLGLSPDDVTINGAVHAEADWFPPKNATQNFWRGAENLSAPRHGDRLTRRQGHDQPCHQQFRRGGEQRAPGDEPRKLSVT
jgi:hypothetical protein